MISMGREIINPIKKKTRNNCLNAYDRSLSKARNNNDSYHDAVNVFVTSECIHLYILCIVPRCLFWDVSVM